MSGREEEMSIPHATRAETCMVPVCSRPAEIFVRGLCRSHYCQWQAAGKPVDVESWVLLARPIGFRSLPRFCGVVGCSLPYMAKGYCDAHYGRLYRTGSVGVAEILQHRLPNQVCDIRQCGRRARAQGLCNNHYQCYRVMKYVTAEDYNAAYDRQGGTCAICKRVPQPVKGPGRRQGFHADHDHVTGVLRGLLCPPCNVALGHLHDDADIAQAAADYLRIDRG